MIRPGVHRCAPARARLRGVGLGGGRGSPVFAVIAGGGTGGHVMPAIAVAEALIANGHGADDIVFVGAVGGMEQLLVPSRGLELVAQHVTNFPRPLNRRAVGSAYRLARASVDAVVLFRRRRPHVVVSVGGYASVAPVIAARLLRIPVVALAYDAVPGLATRLTARVATATAVAFEECRLPRRTVTGTPIRAEIAAIDRSRDRDRARTALGLPLDRFVLFVVGGSIGSGALNDLIDEFVKSHRGRRDLAVRHVIGARNADGSRVPLDGADGLLYQVVAFEDRMEHSYAAADLVLARAGATVVAELAAVGVASVLVPWPGAAGDHQSANARALADRGAAVLIPENELTPERFSAEFDRLQHDPNARASIGGAARAAGHPDAAAAIAMVIERCAR